MGTRDPRKFANFLRQQCEEHGVSILFNTQVISVHISSSQELVGITIQDRHGACELACCNLVIAAGSWSSKVLNTLFPESLFHLAFDKTHLSAGNWLILKAPRPPGSEYCHQVYVKGITGMPVKYNIKKLPSRR
jgi:glycine/D-amino acid oxidase-like deaminating enzyme